MWNGFNKNTPTVGVIGLGYVGLPLVLQFVRGGCRVIGFDIDQKKVDSVNKGESYIQHISADEIKEAIGPEKLECTSDFTRIKEIDACLICVPTPLSKHREPDLKYVLATADQIGGHIKKGHLIVLESTTYPGTTEGELKDALENASGLSAGGDFLLAYSPEREDPGNAQFSTNTIPKVVGGMTKNCTDAAVKLYSYAVEQVVPVEGTKTAEACKLMENIFRCVNIAMVNELKVVFDKMGINVWQVIEAAKTKPFGFMPFYPGPGLGGHCIPIDPFYLTWKAREFHAPTKFIELAGEVNTSMPEYVINKTMEALSDHEKAMKNSKILLIGLAYKKDVDDDRESPTYVLWEMLESRGALVSYHDPFIPKVRPSREYEKYAGIESVELTSENLSQFDAVLISTNHSDVDYDFVVKNSSLVIDTRNACKSVDAKLKNKKVVMA